MTNPVIQLHKYEHLSLRAEFRNCP